MDNCKGKIEEFLIMVKRKRKIFQSIHTVDPKHVPKELIINRHSDYLVDTEMAGNGYHGRCAHCGLAYVTDLGYCSWSGTTCTERAPQSVNDLPENLKSFVKFNGMRMVIRKRRPIFVKSYSDKEMTLKQLNKHVKNLMREHIQMNKHERTL